MPKKAAVKYRSLRSNLVHLPLSLFASLAQQQARPQGLILHLSPLISPSSSSRPPRPAYLGWSGLAAASSLAGISGEAETIELDPEVALGLSWAEGTLVEISIIHNPVKARNITVTPLTTDDWEILEQHADYLENNLLGQLRAAQKGQVIDVWVQGKTKIRIRVDDTTPTTSSTSAVLLNGDTEVYVAPRPRQPSKPAAAAEASTTLATNKPRTGKEKGISVPPVEVRLVPYRVAQSWCTLPSDSNVSKSKGSLVALASRNTIAAAAARIGNKNVEKARVHLVRSKEKTSSDEEDATGGQSGAYGDAGRKDGAAGDLNEGGEEVMDVALRIWDEIPDGHMVLSQPIQGWDHWHQLSIRAPISNQTLSSPKQTERAPSQAATLAGVDKVTRQCLEHFSDIGSDFAESSGTPPRPLLLTGAKGSGRTSIAKRVARALESDREILAETLYIDVARTDLDGRLSKIKEEITSWRDQADSKAPCLLILDGLDQLLMPEGELGTSTSSNNAVLAAHFVRTFAELPEQVMLLATATASTALHPLLNTKHVFAEMVKIPAATKETRQEILRSLVNSVPHMPRNDRSNGSSALKLKGITNGSSEHGAAVLDYVSLASMTDGYTAADMKDLVSGATQQAIIRCAKSGENDASLVQQDFVEAQAAFTPLNLRGVALQKSDVQWSDIGGLHEARRILRETLEWPTKYAQIFANCPLRLRSGILLYGYPGCGKTLLASAVAKECGLNFISVKGPEILNKYIGASEKSVRDLFERASAAKPCVLFFDEFDSIAPKRGHDSTGVTDRVVNQMLTEMDGAQGLDGVYVLAATSRPDLIDPALLRPGRLDKAVFCDMPDLTDRLEILQALAKKLPFETDINLEDVAARTEGYSGADLQALVYNAHLEVVHSQLDTSHRSPVGTKAADIGQMINGV